MRFLLFSVGLSLISLSTAAHAQPVNESWRIYRLGNSLTWQSSSPAIAAMFAQRGFTHVSIGYHVNCGSSLINSWKNPEQTCRGIASVPSAFRTALPEHDWDAMSAQPFRGNDEIGPSTLADDIQVITDLRGLLTQRPANADSPLFIYAVHPYNTTGMSYDEFWTQTADAAPASQETHACREYYDRLYSGLETAFPPNKLSLIPTGEVMYQLNQLMQQGEFPGFEKIEQFYSDDIHLTNAGNYLLGLTTFAAYSGQDPWGMDPASVGFNHTKLNAEQLELLHDTLWKVLASDSRVKPIWYSEIWPFKIHSLAHGRDAIVTDRGTLVEAVALGSSQSVSVDGVVFQPAAERGGLTKSVSDPGVFSQGRISAEFEQLLDTYAQAPNAEDSVITLDNLKRGSRYEVQLFVADQRAEHSKRRLQAEIQGKTTCFSQVGMGFTVSATFIATGMSEPLTLRAVEADGTPAAPQLNAFQVREIR